MMRQRVEALPGRPRWGSIGLVLALVAVMLIGWKLAPIGGHDSTTSEPPKNETPVDQTGSRALDRMPKDYVMQPPSLSVSAAVPDAPPPTPPVRDAPPVRPEPPPVRPMPPPHVGPPTPSKEELARQREAREAKLKALKSRTLTRPADQSKADEAVLKPPKTPYQLSAGALIPLIEEDEIESTVPGLASFVVREDVKDSLTGRHVLIPWGTKVLVRTSAASGPGGDRYQVTALTMSFKNLYELELKSAQVGDASGKAGLADQVDHQTWNIIATMVVDMLRRAPMAMAGGYTGGASTQMGQMAAQEAAMTGTQHAKTFLNTTPVYTIRDGYLATIRLEQSIAFPAPYPFMGVSGTAAPSRALLSSPRR